MSIAVTGSCWTERDNLVKAGSKTTALVCFSRTGGPEASNDQRCQVCESWARATRDLDIKKTEIFIVRGKTRGRLSGSPEETSEPELDVGKEM